MKVTVCFGPIRVVVPCGSGDMTVAQLTSAAVARYKRALGKLPDYPVNVHSLRTESSGGILDPYDQLCDVVDHNEQIIAIHDEPESCGGTGGYHGEQGSSGEGGGTCSSPDLHFSRGTRQSNSGHRRGVPQSVSANAGLCSVQPTQSGAAENTVEVTDLEITPSGLLVVRRESEPSSHPTPNGPNGNVEPEGDSSSSSGPRYGHQKWPTSPDLQAGSKLDQPPTTTQSNYDKKMSSSLQRPGAGDSGRRFARTEARKSCFSDRWLDAAEKAEQEFWEKQDSEVGANNNNGNGPSLNHDSSVDSINVVETSYLTLSPEVVLNSDKGGPSHLGANLRPYYEDGRMRGVVVSSLDRHGRLAAQGRIYEGDRITEINGQPVAGMSFDSAQRLLEQAGVSGSCTLQFVRVKAHSGPPAALHDPARPTSRHSSSSPSSSPLRKGGRDSFSTQSMGRGSGGQGRAKSLPASRSLTPVTPATPGHTLQKANTRRIGRKISIDLVKGGDGLGFSVTTRDLPAGGDQPIYIKNILPKGAAIVDGRLKAGDRLLQVDDVEVTGKTQSEVVSLLRSVAKGESVQLQISRQDSVSPLMPRQLPYEKSEAEKVDQPIKELSTFEIMLNDSSSAGLGLSVKGRTAQQGRQDLGIFVKNIMKGGAAYKNGNLQVNDQLVSINGHQLLSYSNDQAMAILRQAMQELDPNASKIQISVLRPVAGIIPGSPDPSQGSSEILEAPRSPPGELSFSLDDGWPMKKISSGEKSVKKAVPAYATYANASVKSPTLNLGGEEEIESMIMDDQDHLRRSARSSRRGTSNQIASKQDYKQSLEECPPSDQCSTVGEDEFARDAPHRQSMSEKRHAAGKLDPSHLATFQKIKHSRQASAPTLQSFDTHPSSPAQARAEMHGGVKDGLSTNVIKPGGNMAGSRKSWSMESLSTLPQAPPPDPVRHTSRAPLIHEMVVPPHKDNGLTHAVKAKVNSAFDFHVTKRKKQAARNRPTNDSFRQAVDRSYPEDGDDALPPPVPPHRERGVDVDSNEVDSGAGGDGNNLAGTVTLPRTRAQTMTGGDVHVGGDKGGLGEGGGAYLLAPDDRQTSLRDKTRDRRHSAGGLKSWLKSLKTGHHQHTLKRDESVEKKTDEARKFEIENQRIKEHYEKWKKEHRDQSPGGSGNGPPPPFNGGLPPYMYKSFGASPSPSAQGWRHVPPPPIYGSISVSAPSNNTGSTVNGGPSPTSNGHYARHPPKTNPANPVGSVGRNGPLPSMYRQQAQDTRVLSNQLDWNTQRSSSEHMAGVDRAGGGRRVGGHPQGPSPAPHSNTTSHTGPPPTTTNTTTHHTTRGDSREGSRNFSPPPPAPGMPHIPPPDYDQYLRPSHKRENRRPNRPQSDYYLPSNRERGHGPPAPLAARNPAPYSSSKYDVIRLTSGGTVAPPRDDGSTYVFYDDVAQPAICPPPPPNSWNPTPRASQERRSLPRERFHVIRM